MPAITWVKLGIALFNLLKVAALVSVYMQARKAGRLETAHEVLLHTTKKLEEMAAIAASPVSNDEVEQRLKDGTF